MAALVARLGLVWLLPLAERAHSSQPSSAALTVFFDPKEHQGGRRVIHADVVEGELTQGGSELTNSEAIVQQRKPQCKGVTHGVGGKA